MQPSLIATETSQPIRILVVDDDEMSGRLFATSLNKIHCEIYVVRSGKDALISLQTRTVNIILLDLLMPDMDGIEVLSHLKNHEEWQHIPVIIISCVADTDKVVQCMKMGAVDYLIKPINSVILIKRLEAALSNRRLQQVEQEIQAAVTLSDAKWHAIFNATVDGIITTNEYGMIELINPAAEHIFGYESGELINKDISILMSPETSHNQVALVQTGGANILGKGIETQGTRKDGSLFPLYFALNKVKVGEKVFFTSIVRDLSEIKQLEEGYQVLVDNSIQGLAILQNNKVVFVNPSFIHITGLTPKRLLQMTTADITEQLVHPEDQEHAWQRHQERVAGHSVSPHHEVRIIRPDGIVRWLDLKAISINYQGAPAIQVMILDVTEQKQAEEAYEVLVENSIQGLAIFQEGWVVFVNPAFEVITGRQANKLLQMTTAEFNQTIIYPEDENTAWQYYQDRLTGKSVPKHYETRIIRPDGAIRWVEINAALINYQGKPATQSTVLDITEQKEAEKAYQVVVENALHGLAIIQEHKLVFINPAFLEITGFTHKELLNLSSESFREKVIHPKDRKAVWKRYQNRAAGKFVPNRNEMRVVRPDGIIRWVEVTSTLINYQNKPAMQVMMVDITERKQVEEAYQILVDNSLQGLAILQETIIFVNHAYTQIVGYAPEELLGMTASEFIQKIIHPDYRQIAWRLHQDRLSGKSLQTKHEDRIIRGDGQVRWTEVRGIVINYQGKPATQIMVLDITKRKEAETALLMAFKRTKALYEVSRTLISYKNLPYLLQTVVDEVANTLLANRVWLHIFDLEQKQVKHFIAGGPGKAKFVQDISFDFNHLMKGLIGWVIRNKQSATVAKGQQDKRVSAKVRQERMQWNMGSIVVSPIQHQKQTIGTLTVVNCLDETDFTLADIQLVESLGQQVSVAIENVALYNIEQQQKRELELRNDELDAFAGMVAHDLKNQLSAVYGFAYLLQESHLTVSEAVRSRWIESLIDSTEHMKQVIYELLLLARIRREDVQLKPVDMDNVLCNVQKRLHNMIEEYEPELIITDNFPVTWGYAPWLEEVWVNYISNALKYGGKPPHIKVGVTLQELDIICFWVQDNGDGIDLINQKDLFKPFMRFNDKVEGHGLGLSIVQRIIEKLGGNVGVHSQVGEGSHFWFTLPAYLDHLE